MDEPNQNEESRKAKISTFQEVTGASQNEAIYLLESCNWQINEAVTIYLNKDASNEEPFLYSDDSMSYGTPVNYVNNAPARIEASAMKYSSAACPNVLASAISEGDLAHRRLHSVALYFQNCSHAMCSVFCRVCFLVFKFFKSIILGGPNDNNFSAKFEKRFGVIHPKFFNGTFYEAVRESQRLLKVLVVYIHSDVSQESQKICKEILCNQDIIDILDNNYIFWSQDIYRLEVSEVCRILQARTFPYFSIILVKSIDILQQLEIFEGNNFKLDKVHNALMTCLLLMSYHREDIESKRSQKEEDRLLRQQQDKEYEESLKHDTERQKKRLIEEQRKIDEERKNQEKMDMINERRKKRHQDATEIRNRRKTMADEFRLKMSDRIDSSSNESNSGYTKICLKLPCGTRIEGTFKNSDYVETVYHWAECAEFLYPHISGIKIPAKFRLSIPLTSRHLCDRKFNTLEEADLCPNAVVLLSAVEDSDIVNDALNNDQKIPNKNLEYNTVHHRNINLTERQEME